ncbi:MAG: phosphatidylglycerophosphatase [Acidobacteria bacterium]|jgi:phosphatidylglycerophosphatase A|nr:phosphatidylglycerophosphatase [Acidobacteriota bacterium]
MPGYDEIIHTSAAVEAQKLAAKQNENKSFLDYFSLGVTTFGVGYLPLAPGTWGSAVGVLIYLGFRKLESDFSIYFSDSGFLPEQISAIVHVGIAFLFLLFCLLGIWAANRATELFKNKDPQQAVVDEVIGQLLVFLFVPFNISWKLVLAGFLLFRLFDIWKPYPIDSLQNLPAGIGVCADDILAGVYGGAILSLLYALSLIV